MFTYLLATSLLLFQPPPQVVQVSPTLEDYEKALDIFTKKVKVAFDLDHWKNVELVNKKTSKKIKFSEFSEIDKHIFLLLEADRWTKETTILAKFWTEEVEKFNDPLHQLVPLGKIENPKQKAATQKDVEKYQKQLLDLRKSFALKYEAQVELVMKKFKDDIPQKERDDFLKKVREFHDKEKLIERK